MPLNTIPNKGLTSRGYPSDRLVTPIIINGDMSVAQRGTSATSLSGGGGLDTVDRFRRYIYQTGTWTNTQSTDVPTGQGFANSWKWDCTTADASLSSAAEFGVSQRIEGQNLQMLKKGTSSAESTTVSFWVKSNKTGTYICELFDGSNSRHINKSYTISSADTWEKKIITFAGDTTGAINNNNNTGLELRWWLANGTTWTSGTLQTSWGTRTDANRAVGQVNLADSTSNEWYITGVQLEVGEFDSTTIPSFPFESYDVNLTRCMRYFERVSKDGNRSYGPIANGMQRTTTQAYGHVMCRVLKRASANSVSQSNIIVTDRKTTDADVTAIGNISTDYQGVHMDFTHSSFGADYRPVFITGDNATGGYVDIDSEL